MSYVISILINLYLRKNYFSISFSAQLKDILNAGSPKRREELEINDNDPRSLLFHCKRYVDSFFPRFEKNYMSTGESSREIFESFFHVHYWCEETKVECHPTVYNVCFLFPFFTLKNQEIKNFFLNQSLISRHKLFSIVRLLDNPIVYRDFWYNTGYCIWKFREFERRLLHNTFFDFSMQKRLSCVIKLMITNIWVCVISEKPNDLLNLRYDCL